MTAREKYFRGIVSKLAYYATELSLEDTNHLYNGNTVSEDCFAKILNRVYGWNLINANDIQMNMQGIDLVDPAARVAVQVTTTDTREKIKHTIEEFNDTKKKIYESYDRLIIFLLKETAKEYKKDFEALTKGSFHPKEDILDFHKMTLYIHSTFTEVEELKELDEFFGKELLNNASVHQNLNNWAEEYKKYWNHTLNLLQNTQKTLAATFVMPSYQDNQGKVQDDLEEELLWNWSDKSDQDPQKDHRMRVIFGDAGCGKTSLICWYLNQPENAYRSIEVYRFADMTSIDWTASNAEILRGMLRFLNVPEISGLSGKTLILDGFDEVSMNPQYRIDLLNAIYRNWVNAPELKNFQLMITCRKKYVHANWNRQQYPFLIIMPFTEEKVQGYIDKLTDDSSDSSAGKKTKSKKKQVNLQGIYQADCRNFLTQPRILCFLFANSRLKLESQLDYTDVYDTILSPENGIYGLRIRNQDGYLSEPYDPWRSDISAEQSQLIDSISRRAAIYMFRNSYNVEYETLSCPVKLANQWIKEEISKSTDYDLNATSQNLNIISQGLFHIVETDPYKNIFELKFVSHSIYEYLIAGTLYSCMENLWNAAHYNPQNQKRAEQDLLGQLQYANLSDGICQMLTARFKRNHLSESDFGWWENLWAKFLRCGMLDAETIYKEPDEYAGAYEIMENNELMRHIRRESMCFINMANLIQVLYKASKCERKIFEKEDLTSPIARYLRIATESGWYQAEIHLENYKLDGIVISGTATIKMSLTGASIQNAKLIRCVMDGTNLIKTDFRNTAIYASYFIRSKLSGANLEGAIFKNSGKGEYLAPDFSKVNDFTGVRILKKDFEILKKNPHTMPVKYEYIYIDGEKILKNQVDELLNM